MVMLNQSGIFPHACALKVRKIALWVLSHPLLYSQVRGLESHWPTSLYCELVVFIKAHSEHPASDPLQCNTLGASTVKTIISGMLSYVRQLVAAGAA